MATDLLGPNDWGKLPPEQLWNVLKVKREPRYLEVVSLLEVFENGLFRLR